MVAKHGHDEVVEERRLQWYIHVCITYIYIYVNCDLFKQNLYIEIYHHKRFLWFSTLYSLYTITFTKLPSLAPTTYKMHFKLHSTADQLFYKLEPTIPSALYRHIILSVFTALSQAAI